MLGFEIVGQNAEGERGEHQLAPLFQLSQLLPECFPVPRRGLGRRPKQVIRPGEPAEIDLPETKDALTVILPDGSKRAIDSPKPENWFFTRQISPARTKS